VKIAIATSNFKDVDHFGKAQKFMIYEFHEENMVFIEKRDSKKIKGEKHQWQKSLDAVKDCEVVICAQSGLKGKISLKNTGIKLVEYESTVEEVIEMYVSHFELPCP